METQEATLLLIVNRILVEHRIGAKRSRADISLKKAMLRLIVGKCA